MTEKPPEGRLGCGCGILCLIVVGSLALCAGGCGIREAVVATRMSRVKVGMTSKEVETNLGSPIYETTWGSDPQAATHEIHYRGMGDSYRIAVTFDHDFKVIKVERWHRYPRIGI